MVDGRSAFLRAAAAWTGALAAVGAAIAWVVSGGEMALGVAVGAVLGWGNLVWLDRALFAAIRERMASGQARGRWSLPLAFLVKWPLVVLALAFALWYMPARPEGVALGVLVSLAAAAIAALTARKAGPPAA